jgi:hypothetical protein
MMQRAAPLVPLQPPQEQEQELQAVVRGTT